MALTHCQFASSVAYLASRCASWAGECADNMGEPHKPMNNHSVARYLEMIREHANYIEQRQTQESKIE
jgi:hypothetical protein